MLQAAFTFVKGWLDRLGIEWAPMEIPLDRRLQTLAALVWIITMIMGEMISIAFLLFIIYRTDFYWAGLLYVYWIGTNRDVCNIGGRTISWMRNLSWWSYFRDYFPLKLVKTTDLDPQRNYLFCVFPHGIICTGAFGNFATDATGFSKLFPGMSSHLLTLGGHLLVPFFREFLLSLGLCSASAESITYLLNNKNGAGRCAVLIVGGASESLYCKPGEYKITVSRRKGFVKLAMKSGSPLVPVISFGETDLYDQFDNPKGSWLRSFQDKVKEVTGIAPIIPLGRGILQYNIGIVPLRKRVTTVVGQPMEVEKNLEPTDEEIDRVHQQFITELSNLFEKEKYKYVKNPQKTKLEIV